MAPKQPHRRSGARHLRVAAAPPEDTGELDALRRALLDAGVPAEILDSLSGATTPDELMERLSGAGLPLDARTAVEGLISGFEPLLERGTDPVTAEVSGYEFLAALRAADNAPADAQAQAAMLIDLVGEVERCAHPAALAMLRVLAVTAPAPVRPVATAAADRLVAAGLKDRPWVKGLGAPVAGTAFGHGDTLGAQEAVAVTFRYGRREHAIAVLIDHDLGGGVKDCWVTPDARVIRAGYQQAAGAPEVTFRDYTLAEAAAILRRALDQPACPQQPDQVEDVDTFLDLLRSRVAQLPAGSSRPAARSRGSVHRVKVTIRSTKPPIWRRLEVPSAIPLDRLHRVIQAAFGWEDCHMWSFETTAGDFGTPDPELRMRNGASTKLSAVAPAAGERLRYTYDFGDDWQHDIVVEEVLPAAPGQTYPRCVGGRRAGPPEDCGGVWGYADLLEILADPEHEEHDERLEWLGLESAAGLDPAHFDADAANKALADV